MSWQRSTTSTSAHRSGSKSAATGRCKYGSACELGGCRYDHHIVGSVSRTPLGRMGYFQWCVRHRQWHADPSGRGGFCLFQMDDEHFTTTYDVRSLRKAGYKADMLVHCGFSVDQVAAGWSNVNDLRGFGLTVQQLLGHGFSITELVTAGGFDLKSAGCNVKQLIKEHGCSLEELKNSGFGLRDMLTGGLSHSMIGQVRWPARSYKEEGFTLAELRKCGLTVPDLRSGPFSDVYGYPAIADLRGAGYTIADLRAPKRAGTAAGPGAAAGPAGDVTVTLEQLKEAGYTALEVKEAGYSMAAIADGGYVLRDAGYSIGDVIAGQFSVKKHGFTVAEVRAAGHTSLSNPVYNVYRPTELVAGGFSELEVVKSRRNDLPYLLRDSIRPQALKAASVPLAEAYGAFKTVWPTQSNKDHLSSLRQAGYTLRDFKYSSNASVNRDACVFAAGFSPKDARAAGWPVHRCVRAGYPITSLRAGGYTVEDIVYAPAVACKTLNSIYNNDHAVINDDAFKAFRRACGDAGTLKAAGYTPAELKMSGCLYKVCHRQAGSKVSGYSLAELREAGMSTWALLAMGHSEETLEQQGVPPPPLWQRPFLFFVPFLPCDLMTPDAVSLHAPRLYMRASRKKTCLDPQNGNWLTALTT